VLYEIENGVRRLTKRIRQRIPVVDYLRPQARFRHVLGDQATLDQIQAAVDTAFAATLATRERPA